MISLLIRFALVVALAIAFAFGGLTGGGLTVIANAPNPAGQSILSKFFKDGISPLGLFLGALVPTIILYACFTFLPTVDPDYDPAKLDAETKAKVEEMHKSHH